MAAIKGKNTKPEVRLRSLLHKEGFRFRLHDKKLPGKPDVVLKKYKTAIFVNGCFWHGHDNCKHFRLPKTRTAWWQNKIETTKKRDALKIDQLLETGWNVIIVWECEPTAEAVERIIKILSETDRIMKTIEMDLG